MEDNKLVEIIDYTPLGRAPERREAIDNTPTSWTPNIREADYPPFGLHLPLYEFDPGGEPMENFGPQAPKRKENQRIDNNPAPMPNKGEHLFKFSPANHTP